MNLQPGIEAILAKSDPTGRFTVKRIQEDGSTVEHRCSWGMGMLHQASLKRYTRAFSHPPPRWCQPLHPAKAAMLYALAIEAGQILPDAEPTV